MIRKIGFGFLELCGYLLVFWSGAIFNSVINGIRYGYSGTHPVVFWAITAYALWILVGGVWLAVSMGNRRRSVADHENQSGDDDYDADE